MTRQTPPKSFHLLSSLILFLFLLPPIATPVRAATSVSGSQSGSWTLAASPYLVTSDVFVFGGQTLTIQAGVVVLFQDADDGLIVDGTLIARGTAAEPIRFTSDDTSKAPGQWEAIVFRAANTNSIMENCVVEYAAAVGLSDESIRLESASPTIRNCTISHSRLHGITFLLSDAVVEGCQFLNNGSTNRAAYALAVRADSLPRLRNNSASGNGHDAAAVFGYNFSRSGSWTKDNLPYTIVDDLFVNAGRTLTIDPGVIVQFQDPDDAFVVDGTLVARGTASAPIRFTSDETLKAPGQWEAIIFRGANTNSILEYCVIESAAALGLSDESIRLENASPIIRNCTISNSRLHGMTLLLSDAVVENCLFSGNGSTNRGAYAIAMRTDCLPQFKNNSATNNVHNAIGVFGYNFSRTGTWVKDNLPYTVVDDLFVNSARTLTIAPGVIVQFQDEDDGLLVDGTLIAQGTANAPIRFTSDESAKAPGQWEALVFRSGSTNSILDHCIVEYAAARGIADEAIRCESISPIILNTTVSQSRMHGINLLLSDSRIENSVFLNNGTTNDGFAIAMRTDCLPRFKNNTARDNGRNAIAVYGYNFSRSGSWVRDNLPYTVVDDLFINSGRILTLEPGVIIQFQDADDALVVDGTLVARGTTAAPVRFTSDELAKAPGQWEAIIFRASNTNSIMENCVVEYAAAGGISDESIRFESASATIRSCTISHSRLHGITFLLSDAVVEACQFLNNGSTNRAAYALAVRADSLPRLRNNSASGNGHDATAVFGYNFSRSGSWTKDNLPYTIVDDLFVNAGRTLTIEAGITVQFQDTDDALVVDGTLVAQGTAAAPIRFTSDEAQKAAGQWEGIIFRDGTVDASTVLDNCLIEYGGANAEGSVQFFAASPRIANTTVANSASDGIYAISSSPALSQIRVLRNRRDGIRTVNRANPVISNSVIAGNTGFGVQNLDTSVVISARGNFWGDPSGPLDTLNTDGRGQTNPNGKGDKVSEYVDWATFLQNDPVGTANTPDIDLPNTVLSFGAVAVGASQDSTLIVRNIGPAALTVSAIAISNSRFSVVSPNLPFSVANNGQQVVTIRFAPSDTGTQNGTLTIANNDPDEAIVTATLTGSGMISGVSTNCVPPAPGLVAWWPAEANAIDLAGTNHGTLRNGAAFVPGKVGHAFSFDGADDQVSIPESPAINISQMPRWTITAWIKPATFTGQTWPTIYSEGRWGASLGLSDGTGKLESWINSGNQSVSTNSVPLNEWSHVALAYDGTQRLFYINGVIAGTGSAPAVNADANGSAIGDVTHSPNSSRFNGLIDELDLYNRALSDLELRAIFTAGSAGKCQGTSMTGPAVIVSTNRLDFGSVVIGQTNSLILTVRNLGNAVLAVTAISSSNPRFAASPGSFSVSAGGNTSVAVRFIPTAAGTEAGQLSLASNDPDEPTLNIGLNGTGLTVSPVPLDPPRISSITPVNAAPGSVVTLAGTNFGSSASEALVEFGQHAAAIQSLTATQIVARLPLAVSGVVPVTVIVGGLASDEFAFQVQRPPSSLLITAVSLTPTDLVRMLTQPAWPNPAELHLESSDSPAGPWRKEIEVVRNDFASGQEFFTPWKAHFPKRFFRVGAFASQAAPVVRFISPNKLVRPGQSVTLLGANFSSNPAENTVRFDLPNQFWTAVVTEAAPDHLVVTVPPNLPTSDTGDGLLYRVTVTTAQGTGNGVGCWLYTTTGSMFSLRPTEAFLLQPPGTGMETLAIGGGVPPYQLLPLTSNETAIATVTLKGPVITVAAKTNATLGSVAVRVQDSSNPPQQARADVYIRRPEFAPPFNAQFHTLLAGTAPGVTVTARFQFLQPEQLELRFQGAAVELAHMRPGFLLGLVRLYYSSSAYDFQDLVVKEVTAGRAIFEVVSRANGGVQTIARGELIQNPPTVIINALGQLPGSIMPTTVDQEIIFSDAVFRLPASPGQGFSVIANLTSVSANETQYLPLRSSVTNSFMTAGVAPGAPRIERLLPVHGEVGRNVALRGTGFDPNPSNNRVTFAGPRGVRVPAEILMQTNGEVFVTVPNEAISGPVRMTVGGQTANDFSFFVRFHPKAALAFDTFASDTPARPRLLHQQPVDEDETIGEVPLQSLIATLDRGRLELTGVSSNQQVGTVIVENFYTGRSSTNFIFYAGRELSLTNRHRFDVHPRSDSTLVLARIYASDDADGNGVTFTVEGGDGLFQFNAGIMWDYQFTTPIYRPPAGRGTDVSIRLETISRQWMSAPELPMRRIQHVIRKLN
jgi:hypothetical protein